MEDGEGMNHDNDAEARGLANVNCRESISCSMESALETLLGLVHVAPCALLAAVFADAALVQGLALLLCRSSTSTFDGVALSAISLVGLLAQKDGQHRAEHTGGSPVVAPKINALLSNAVLRVVDTCIASAASSGGHATDYEQLSVIDAALGAFIDLHSSDDGDILENFVRLHAPKRLAEFVTFGDASLRHVRSRMNDDAWDPSDFEETLENVQGLLAYKRPWVKV